MMRKFKKGLYYLIAFPVLLPPTIIVFVLNSLFEFLDKWLEEAIFNLKDMLLETDYTSQEAFKVFAKMYNRYINVEKLSASELDKYIDICSNALGQAFIEQEKREKEKGVLS